MGLQVVGRTPQYTGGNVSGWQKRSQTGLWWWCSHAHNLSAVLNSEHKSHPSQTIRIHELRTDLWALVYTHNYNEFILEINNSSHHNYTWEASSFSGTTGPCADTSFCGKLRTQLASDGKKFQVLLLCDQLLWIFLSLIHQRILTTILVTGLQLNRRPEPWPVIGTMYEAIHRASPSGEEHQRNILKLHIKVKELCYREWRCVPVIPASWDAEAGGP